MAPQTVVQKAASAIARIPYLARDAKTAAQLAELVETLKTEIADEQARVAEMEAKRPTLIIDGGDIDRFTSDMALAGQRLQTLQANLSTMEKKRQETEQAEADKALVQRAKQQRTASDKALPEAYRNAYDALVGLCEAYVQLVETETAQATMNGELGHAGRKDLQVNLRQYREQALADIGRIAMPIEEPEEPPAFRWEDGPKLNQESEQSWRDRNDRERAQAESVHKRQFVLRKQNYEAMRTRHVETTDPFAVIGEAARKVIEDLCFPMDAYEREANRKLITTYKFQRGGVGYERPTSTGRARYKGPAWTGRLRGAKG